MPKRMGREITLLCLPVLLIIGVGYWINSIQRPEIIKPVSIMTWTYTDKYDFRPQLTLEWNRTWLESRRPLEFQTRGWLLDGNGKVIDKQNGYAFNKIEGSTNRYLFHTGYMLSKRKKYKEPLIFQAVLKINDMEPVQVNCLLPPIMKEDKIRPSKFPMQPFKF